jgi:hypothetical protein
MRIPEDSPKGNHSLELPVKKEKEPTSVAGKNTLGEGELPDAGLSLANLLGKLSESALEIIEPDDFLDILTDLLSRLPPSFSSVVGGVLEKSREILLSRVCDLVTDFAMEVVRPCMSDSAVSLAKLDNLTCIYSAFFYVVLLFIYFIIYIYIFCFCFSSAYNAIIVFISEDLVKTTFMTSLCNFTEQHVRRNISHIQDLESFIQKFIVRQIFLSFFFFF